MVRSTVTTMARPANSLESPAAAIAIVPPTRLALRDPTVSTNFPHQQSSLVLLESVSLLDRMSADKDLKTERSVGVYARKNWR